MDSTGLYRGLYFQVCAWCPPLLFLVRKLYYFGMLARLVLPPLIYPAAAPVPRPADAVPVLPTGSLR
jgi:hypothetical protein